MDHVILKFPTLDETLDCNELYDDVYEKATKDGVWTKEDMLFQLNGMKIYLYEDDKELENLSSRTVFKYPVVKELPSKENTPEVNRFIDKTMTEIIKGQRKIRTSNLLTQSEESLDPDYQNYKKLATLKNRYIKLTCEGLAEGLKNEKLTFYSVYKNQNERLWKTYEEFLNCKNRLLINSLVTKVLEFLNGTSVTTLRRIARHQSWRTRWVSAIHTGSNLFRNPISEWTQDQIYLAFWSNYYTSIGESYEPPDSWIVEDDEKLDNYLISKTNDKTKMNDNSTQDVNRAFFKTKVNPVAKKK